MKIRMKAILIAMVLQVNLVSSHVLADTTEFVTKIPVQNQIKIDIISDVVCPWCAIGYKRLSQAINELEVQERVQIQWHPFQLNPTMPKDGMNADKYLSHKLRLSPEGLKQKRNSVAKTAQDSGFEFNYFEEMKKPNTFNAHVLLDYAREFNKQTELKVRLQEAYFTEKRDIGNINVLYSELTKVGLNADDAIKSLSDADAIKRVKDDEAYWKSRGVSSIPTMLFDQRIARRGANSVDTYKAILTQLLNLKG